MTERLRRFGYSEVSWLRAVVMITQNQKPRNENVGLRMAYDLRLI